MEAVRGQKHPLEAKNGMRELIYWKKFLNNLQNPLAAPIRFELWPQIKKIQQPPVEVATAAAAATVATAATIIRAIQWFWKVSKPLQLQMISGRFYKFKNRHLEF